MKLHDKIRTKVRKIYNIYKRLQNYDFVWFCDKNRLTKAEF